MDSSQLTKLLIDNVSFGLRHANYERTIEIKRVAKMLSTGTDQDDEVTRYRRWEDDKLKEQRIRLYNSPTKYALSRPRKYWKRMHRVEGIRKNFKPSDQKAFDAMQLELYNFMPGESLEQWQNRILEYYGVTDPNAWIIYERHDERNIEGTIIKTITYPVIVGCEDLTNFKRSFGKLEWIIARFSEMETVATATARVEQVLETYMLYAPGFIIKLREIGENTVIDTRAKEVEVTIPNYIGGGIVTERPNGREYPFVGANKERRFYLSMITNGATEVPAECVGVYMDEVTGQQVYVPWFNPAEDVFKDLIRDKVLADVLRIIYAYPKTWEFTKGCTHQHHELGQCEHGYYNGMRDAEHMCSACKGTGIPANFTTEQATVQLILPDTDQDKVIELAKLSHTQPIDIGLLTWLEDVIEKTDAKIMAAVFDSGIVQRTNGTKTMTATQSNAIMEGIADVLAPFGAVDSKHFELCYRVSAEYRGFKVEVDKAYPEDLKIEMLGDMVAEYAEMRDSGVGYEVMKSQRTRIQQKTFEGNPEAQKAIEARYKFLPWDDKSEQEAALIMSALSPKDPDRVLRAYHAQIFQEIEAVQVPPFYSLAYDKQKQVVADMVSVFAERMVLVDDGSADMPNFNDSNFDPNEQNQYGNQDDTPDNAA